MDRVQLRGTVMNRLGKSWVYIRPLLIGEPGHIPADIPGSYKEAVDQSVLIRSIYAEIFLSRFQSDQRHDSLVSGQSPVLQPWWTGSAPDSRPFSMRWLGNITVLISAKTNGSLRIIMKWWKHVERLLKSHLTTSTAPSRKYRGSSGTNSWYVVRKRRTRRRVSCLRNLPFCNCRIPRSRGRKTKKIFYHISKQSPERYTDETAQTLIDTGFEPDLLRKLSFQ